MLMAAHTDQDLTMTMRRLLELLAGFCPRGPGLGPWMVVVLAVLACKSTLAGTACIPYGYGTTPSPTPVITFAAMAKVDTKKLLYQRNWISALVQTECTQDANARLYMAPDFSAPYFRVVNRQSASVSQGVKISFEALDDASQFRIPEALFSIVYTTTIVCTNGAPLGVARDSTGAGFVITGINAEGGCAGKYVVTYDIQVWQVPTQTFPTGATFVTLGGRGFRLVNELQTETGGLWFARSGALANSSSFNFVANVGCDVRVPSTSISLPDTTLDSIKNPVPTTRTYFDVILSNCQGGSQSNKRPVMVTWRFSATHPSDPTLMMNGDTTSDAAKNIALKMFVLGLDSSVKPIEHQVPVDSGRRLPLNAGSQTVLRHFVQYALTPEGQADANVLSAGKFSGQAQLFVQYQ